jgi:hypothetical protein
MALQRNDATCQEATYAPQQTAPLFDHLVGDGEHLGRHVEAERFCGLEIDDEFKPGGQAIASAREERRSLRASTRLDPQGWPAR